MKKFITLLFVLGVFISRSKAQVEGGITDAGGKKITAALLVAYNSEGKVADSVRSDKAGFFEFKKLVPGKYAIEVKATGYKTAKEENVEVRFAYKARSGRNDLSGATRLDIVLIKQQ